MFENSKWIARNLRVEVLSAPYLRKKFSLKFQPKSAVLHICGLGTGEYYINGKTVTQDVLITPVTKYDTRVIYSTFDVTELLHQGENVIGALLGNSWYNISHPTEWDSQHATWKHCPKLICQLDITYGDGTTQTVVSDTTWKTADSPITFNELRFGVYYDARLEIKDWNLLKCDDSNWENAFISRPPGGELVNTPYTPIRVIRTLKPVKINNNVYDFGENLSGWVKVSVVGGVGKEITIRYSERIHPDGSINQHNVNIFLKNNDANCDRYICRGVKKETFEQRLVYHGFRYVEVSGNCEIIDVEASLVHADLDIIGEFSSSDETLNWIHQAERRATLTNYMSFPTDCPHREQNGWTGDAAISADQSQYNYDMKTAYMKWFADIKDSQRPTGSIPAVVPTTGYGYNYENGPAWDAALMLMPMSVYNFTGDSEPIRFLWDNMCRYMEFICGMTDNYIVAFGIGDWLSPETTVKCPVEITDTAYFYKFASTMAEYARILGYDPTKYEELAKNIKAAFRERFMENGKMRFDTQTAVACAMYQGLFNEDEMEAAAARLAQLVREMDYHIDCGILGTKYIFDSLAEYGYNDVLYKMVTNPTCPSYAHWKNIGMTTLCEMWDTTVVPHVSDNHHMFGEGATWLFKHVAGIKAAEPGFSRVILQPALLPQLDWVKAHHRGISIEWNRQTIRFASDVDGTLVLPHKSVEFKSGEYIYDISSDELKAL